jgi:hypothetical protein
MTSIIITNALSLNMLASLDASLTCREVSAQQASEIAVGATSAVGHADTAAIFSTLLGIEVPAARTTVRLSPGDRCLVGQYIGPRLPEGATSLPEGASVRWVMVSVA